MLSIENLHCTDPNNVSLQALSQQVLLLAPRRRDAMPVEERSEVLAGALALRNSNTSGTPNDRFLFRLLEAF